jgi:hypothetical protein
VSRGPKEGTDPGDTAILVTDTPTGTSGPTSGPTTGTTGSAGDANGSPVYLIWRDTRYQLTDYNLARAALQLDQQVNIPDGGAWLKALPAGQAIAPITVDGAGKPSTAASGLTAGQVVKVDSSGQSAAQYYLVGSTQLIPISELQALLQQAKGAKVTPISLNAAANASKAATSQASQASPPATVPKFVRPALSSTVLCAAYSDGSFTPKVLVDSAIPADGGIPTGSSSTTGIPTADRVWVPPGRAAIVESLATPDATSGPLSLITDEGKRYAIPQSTVLGILGFTGKKVSRLPNSLLVRIPEGPALDPEKARAALQVQKVDS